MAPRRRPQREVETPSATIKYEPVPKPESSCSCCSWDMLLLFVLMIGAAGYIVLHVYLYPIVEKMPPLPNVDPENAPTTWGTYRPHMYFGLRTRSPMSPLFGMMWYEQPSNFQRPNIRHWCNQDDRLPGYYWYEADGRTFGRQNISEHHGGLIQTDWLNEANGFGARVKFEMPRGRRYNVILYLSAQDLGTKFQLGKHLKDIFHGKSELLGAFTMSIRLKESTKVTHSVMLTDEKIPIERYHDFVMDNTQAFEEPPQTLNYMLNEKHNDQEGKFAAIQLNFGHQAEFEIYLHVSRTNQLNAMKSEEFTATLRHRSSIFNKKYQSTFQLSSNYTQIQRKMGKVAISNMLGSLGYWYGFNRVAHHNLMQSYGPHALFSAVPSRPFFPRGFLWDEGFHQMLIRKMDPKLTLEMMVSWMNVMDTSGWIPREMIVGAEAEAKVPAEFIPQKSDVANPPTLFYVMDKLVHDEKTVARYGGILKLLYPRLEKWFHWLRASQTGPSRTTFRWRGRNETIVTELNPKTLSSGLDDFPRASHPSDSEYHLDLRCWMALGARVLERLSRSYGSDADHQRLAKLNDELNNYELLVKDHWHLDGFYDYGRHSEDVALTPVPIPQKDGKPPKIEYQRVTSRSPTLRHVRDVFGYNNLFPLMLKLIPSKSPNLKVILDKIRDPQILWTPFGLRSISRSSPYYMARNTEHDPPYWRGYIWININYMVLSSLRHYSGQPGPYSGQAGEIYEELRANLVKNMGQQFAKTGFLWENYDDKTGEGRGCHPFTGWSSLILLIMSDNLDT